MKFNRALVKASHWLLDRPAEEGVARIPSEKLVTHEYLPK